MSRFHAPTLRDAPNDAELPSHRLLTRAGFIRQLTAGIYDLMPLGQRVVRRITRIIREELDRAGAIEIAMPFVQPAELWQESGRWQKYGPELQRLTDRKGNEYCLGPTHEEIVVDLVRRDVRSYRQLPLNLYQIQPKFRDEVRPRGGLMRGREFLMKDAYSFDVDESSALVSYKAMYDAYHRIFERCGFDFRAVEADTGNIGGSTSHEFQVLAGTGEDAIVSCDTCSYTANVEKAAIGDRGEAADDGGAPQGAPERVDTPDKRTVAEVAEFLGTDAAHLLKTLIVVVDGEPMAAVVRGDHELNLMKVRDALGAEEAELADDATVERVTGAPVGFAGPVGLAIPVVVDRAVRGMAGAVCGANEAHAHLRGVAVGRDFEPARVEDLRMAQGGDPCPRCEGHLRAFRGIEVGHVFYLGTKYTEPMGCTFLDQNGKAQPMVMGCYGIGVTRIMAAAVEQSHDERGIIWPVPLAPFEAAVLPLGKAGDEVYAEAERIYEALTAAGVDALLDDRNERPGVKFADAELMGFPWQVVLGRRGLKEGVAELKSRATGEAEKIPLTELVSTLAARIEAART